MWVIPNPFRVFKTKNEIRLWFNYISFPKNISDDELLPLGVYKVIETPKPSVDYTKNVVEMMPAFDGKLWVQQWGVEEASEDEIKQRENSFRYKNKQTAEKLLQDTDWTQLPDVKITNVNDFVQYRSSIRHIALNPPITVDVWPELPLEIWSNTEE